jgi:maleate cis-trans isomerase
MFASNAFVQAEERMNKDIPMCATYLASAGIDVAVYACTGGSFYKGPGYDKELAHQISKITGVPAVVTSLAVLEALRHLGITKVVVVTPYPDEPGEETELLQSYLEGYGFQVVKRAGKGLGMISNREIGNDLPESVYQFAISKWDPSADGMFLSCTDWRSLEVVGRLEEATGRPVVTSNQATIWATLCTLGFITPVKGYGRLFREPMAAKVH